MTTPPATVRTASGNVELLSIELLEEHARRLAALLSIRHRGGGDSRLHLRQLKTHMRALRAVYNVLADEARREAVSPAGEWLLDNFHIVSAAARDIYHDLPRAFFKRLPAGLPQSDVDDALRELANITAGNLRSVCRARPGLSARLAFTSGGGRVGVEVVP